MRGERRKEEEEEERGKREAGGDDGIWGETGSNCGCDNLASANILYGYGNGLWIWRRHMHGTGVLVKRYRRLNCGEVMRSRFEFLLWQVIELSSVRVSAGKGPGAGA